MRYGCLASQLSGTCRTEKRPRLTSDDTSPSNTSLETPYDSYPSSAVDSHPPSIDPHQYYQHENQSHSSRPNSSSGPREIDYNKQHSNRTSEANSTHVTRDDADDSNVDEVPAESPEWDIYGDYARESMYFKRQSHRQSMKAVSMALPDEGGMASFSLFKAAMEASASSPKHLQDIHGVRKPVGSAGAGSDAEELSDIRPSPNQDQGNEGGRKLVIMSGDTDMSTADDMTDTANEDKKEDPETPKVSGRAVTSPITPGESVFTGRSLATELRLRIQRERQVETEQSSTSEGEDFSTTPGPLVDRPALAPAPPLPARSSSRPVPGTITASAPSSAPPAFLITDENDTPSKAGGEAQRDSQVEVGDESISSDRSGDTLESNQSTVIETPNPPGEGIFTSEPDVADEVPVQNDQEAAKIKPITNTIQVLASPIPLDEPKSTVDPSKYPTRSGPIRPPASRQGSFNFTSSTTTPTPTLKELSNEPSNDVSLSALIPPPPSSSPAPSGLGGIECTE